MHKHAVCHFVTTRDAAFARLENDAFIAKSIEGQAWTDEVSGRPWRMRVVGGLSGGDCAVERDVGRWKEIG